MSVDLADDGSWMQPSACSSPQPAACRFLSPPFPHPPGACVDGTEAAAAALLEAYQAGVQEACANVGAATDAGEAQVGLQLQGACQRVPSPCRHGLKALCFSSPHAPLRRPAPRLAPWPATQWAPWARCCNIMRPSCRLCCRPSMTSARRRQWIKPPRTWGVSLRTPISPAEGRFRRAACA